MDAIKHTPTEEQIIVMDARIKPFVDVDVRFIDQWMPVMTTDAVAFYLVLGRMEDLDEALTLERVAQRTGMTLDRAYLAQGELVRVNLLDITLGADDSEIWNWGIPAEGGRP